jgi:hypothetical protein
MEGTNEEQICEYHGRVVGNIIGNKHPPSPTPKQGEKNEPFLLILAHLIGCLEIFSQLCSPPFFA